MCQGTCERVSSFFSEFKNFVEKAPIIDSDETKEFFDLKNLLLNNKNLILTGAPGTGKTYLAKTLANKLYAYYNFVQFHPSYDYTDFVEGLRPYKDDKGNIAFERRDGIFKEFCKKALQSKDECFVMIIDEINRGEISKIFGELFFSIDSGYRGQAGRVKTQYQNLITDKNDPFYDGFYVPENVYIIGTMNDIDRSVESMDFAMRRRFAWYEIKAIDSAHIFNNNDNLSDEIKASAQKKMEDLNKVISSMEELGDAFNIGGAYFNKIEQYIDDSNDTDSAFTSLWEYNLKGLLFEYLRGLPDAKAKLQKLEDAYYGRSDSEALSE